MEKKMDRVITLLDRLLQQQMNTQSDSQAGDKGAQGTRQSSERTNAQITELAADTQELARDVMEVQISQQENTQMTPLTLTETEQTMYDNAVGVTEENTVSLLQEKGDGENKGSPQGHRWASLIQKLVPLIVGPLLYGLVSLTAGPLT